MTNKGYLKYIQNQLDALICRSHMIPMNKKKKRQFDKLIKNVRFMSEKNKNEAQKYIKKAQEFLDRCEIANIRKWNVEFGIGIFGIIVLIYLGMKSMSDCLWLEYIHISCYGSAGVLLSILKDTHIGSDIGYFDTKSEVFWKIIVKYVIGVFSAVFVIKAFKAGIFMKDFIAPEHNNEFILLLAVVAGYSKDMMFSLVKKIETRAVKMSEIASKETSRKGQTP